VSCRNRVGVGVVLVFSVLQAAGTGDLIQMVKDIAVGSSGVADDRSGAGVVDVGDSDDGGVGAVVGSRRLRQSEMRLSTLLETTHLQRAVEQYEEKARLLEMEVQELELDLAAEDAEDAEAAVANAAAAVAAAAAAATVAAPAPAAEPKSLFSRLLSFKPLSTKKDAEQPSTVTIPPPYISNENNPLAVPRCKEAPPAVAMGSVQLSSNDFAVALSSMIQTIDLDTGGAGGDIDSQAEDVTVRSESTIESTLSVVKLRKKVARTKTAVFDGNRSNVRLTVIELPYQLNAEDMQGGLQETELKALNDEIFDQAQLDGAEPPLNSTEELPLSAKVMSCTKSESTETHGSQDLFTIVIRCGKVTWETKRFGIEFIELREHLFESEGATMHGASMPKLRCEQDAGDPSARLAALGAWLNELLQGLGTEAVLSLAALDEFLEAFWNIEEARRLGPVVVDWMKHLVMSREQAQAALNLTPEGTFLMRERHTGNLALSVCLGLNPTSSSNTLQSHFWHGIVEERESKWFMKGSK
jgi:hypothetical protein